jgi:predicted PurR-regulated permease PerM
VNERARAAPGGGGEGGGGGLAVEKYFCFCFVVLSLVCGAVHSASGAMLKKSLVNLAKGTPLLSSPSESQLIEDLKVQLREREEQFEMLKLQLQSLKEIVQNEAGTFKEFFFSSVLSTFVSPFLSFPFFLFPLQIRENLRTKRTKKLPT